MDKRGQAEVIGDLIRVMMGVFMLLILIGGTYAIYNAFFAPKLTPGEKARDSVVQKLESILPDRSEEVVNPCEEDVCEGFTLNLLPTGNDEPQCNGVACVCVFEDGVDCARLDDIAADCDSFDPCVDSLSIAPVDPYDFDPDVVPPVVGEPILVCRKGSRLFIGKGC